MTESKIGWRRLDGENAWVGVRGRVRLFTLRLNTRDTEWDNIQAETYELPYMLTQHMDNGKEERLVPMKLSEAQRHAERELDNWLAKAGFVEPEPPTLVDQAVQSAMAIVDACVNDGIKSIMDSASQERMATRIAFYVLASSMDELGKLRQKAIETDSSSATLLLSDRRAELAEVFAELGEMLR